MNPREPKKGHIDKLLKNYRKEYFHNTDKTLTKVFKVFPKNDDYYIVLAKVILLDRLYNTNILDPYTVAKHIKELSIDKAVSKGAVNIVEKIAKVRFKSKEKRFYSFATKYCSWHFPENFFIYDKYVDCILWEYKKKFKFHQFYRYELREYKKFHEILLNFIHFFNLEAISKKRLDEFLWLESKKFYGELR